MSTYDTEGIGDGTKLTCVRWDDESNHEQGNDIEDHNAPQHLLGSFWNALQWVGSFGSGKTCQLGATEGERRSGEDAAEAEEAIIKCTGVIPVGGSDIALGTNTARVDNDGENDETNDRADLDDREYEFHFAIAADAEVLDPAEEHEEYRNPHCNVDVPRGLPELKRDTGSGKLEGEDSKPVDSVVPANRETPCGVNEADGVGKERAVYRVHDTELGKSLHHHEHENTDDEEADNQGGRTTSGEGLARADEQTSADCPT